MYIVRLTRYETDAQNEGWDIVHRERETNEDAQKEFRELKESTIPRDEVTITLNGVVIHYWVNKGESR